MRPLPRALPLCLLVLACGQRVKDGDVVLEPLASFAGRVQDRVTGKGLGGVSVSTSPAAGYGTTNAQGEYVLAGGLVPGRAYRLEFDKAGYVPVVLDGVGAPKAGETRVADVELDRAHARLGVQGKDLLLGSSANEAAFSIANVGEPGEILSYSITTTAAWLAFTPQVGNVVDDPAVITVRADRLVLGTNFGVYTATLEIVSNAGAGAVNVRLVHEPEAVGFLTADKTLLDYGGVDKARTVRLDNPGGQPVSWELVALPASLSAAAQSGTVGAGNFALLELRLDRGALLPGTYVGEVRINTDSELQPQLVLAARFEVLPRVSVALTTAFLDLGDALPAKAFGIVNDGNVGFDYEVAPPAPWDSGDPRVCSQRPRISTTPTSGTLPPGGTGFVNVHLDRAGLVPGETAKPVVVTVRRNGLVVERRTVTARYAVKPKAAVTSSIDRSSLDPLHPAANLKLQLGSPALDACDLLSNVPITWTASVAEPWYRLSKTAGLLDLPVVTGGVIDATAAPAGYVHLDVDWSKLPRVAGVYDSTLEVTWCTPAPGLPDSCTATPRKVQFPLSVTVAGPQIEKVASWIEPGNPGFVPASVAAFNPFNTHLLLGPSSIPFHSVGYYWLEWDLTPGAEVGYQMQAGELPDSWDPANMPPDTVTPGSAALAYDWAHDAYVFVWTWVDRNSVARTFTWVYRNAAWTRVTPYDGGIPGIHGASLLYDTRRHKMLLYGGYLSELQPDDTLRAFDFATGQWTVVTTALVGAALDVTRSAMIYDATQDRYLLHGGKPLGVMAGHVVNPVERTWAIDPDTLAVTRLTPVAGYPGAEAWGRQLVHNVEQNITYVYGGCFQMGTGTFSGSEACYDPQLRVLLNGGNHPLPIPPSEAPMSSGPAEVSAWGVFHLAYDSTYDRMLFVGTEGVNDSLTGVLEQGAGAWQLLYDRPLPTLPALSVSTSLLSLGSGTSGSFDVVNGSGTLAVYRVTPIDPWLSVDRVAGYLGAGTNLSITVTAQAAGLTSGTHRGRLRVEGAARQLLEVQVEVVKP